MSDYRLLLSESQIVSSNSLTDYLSSFELKGNYYAVFNSPVSTDILMIILVLDGEMSFVSDIGSIIIRKGELLGITRWIDIESVKYSADFHGYIIFATSEAISDIITNKHYFPPYMKTREYGQNIRLGQKETETLCGDIFRLLNVPGQHEHKFSFELTISYFNILITDIADILWRNYGGKETEETYISRSKLLFRQFILLVKEYIEKENNVKFYADKLCISKQYLSAIVKENENISIGAMLNRIKYAKAVKLLKDPKITIQQAAERLGFSDQSAFGKFFKRNNGNSPLQYRKALYSERLSRMPKTEI